MQSLLALPSFAHSPTYALCNLWRSRYSVPGFGFWRELSIRCFARPMLLIASCLSNAANLHNELSRIAPQASHQLRRACGIMWRLQHRISPKTTKGSFVLCPCHCSFKTSAMPRAHPSSLILHPHHPSLILHPSHAFLILPPAMNQCPIHAWSLHPIPLSSSYVCSPQRLALILLPYVCPLLRQTHHMVVPLNGAECVAVVQTETHMIFCTISKQLLAGAPTCKQARAC